MPVSGSRVQRSEKLKTLEQVVPMEIFGAVGVVDGAGVKRNRIICRFKGTKQFYFLFPEGTEEAMKVPAGWLQDLLAREVGDHTADLPDEKSADIPVGSPL